MATETKRKTGRETAHPSDRKRRPGEKAAYQSDRKRRPGEEAAYQSDRKKGAEKRCPAAAKCGGCDLQGVDYAQQLAQKNRQLKKLLPGLTDRLHPILAMENPLHYRCKVNTAFGLDRKGRPVLGRYEKESHRIVQTPSCMIEDEKAGEIAKEIFSLLPSFRIRVYDEDSGFGYLRHVQIRRGCETDQYMVTLVCTDPVFPSKVHFVKALRTRFPEISTVILNINDRHTSMVLGERNITLYGKGYIEDRLCGCTFRISPGSFYQVNPVQTQRLYETVLRYANLSGREYVLDAYCGTGTIGIIAAKHAMLVTGVELNADAVRDAVWNARRNKVDNIRFVKMDATDYLEHLALAEIGSRQNTDEKRRPDVLFLDPPRSGTTPRFIEAASRLEPEKIIYISCAPDTLARDLKLFRKKGYRAKEVQPVDLFPYTEHVETVCLLSQRKPDTTIEVDLEDYYRIKDEQKKNKASE